MCNGADSDVDDFLQDPGISELKDLVSINLSNNPIKSLEGLEGHKCMRSIDMSDTGVSVLADLQYLKQLPVLEELNLLNTLLFTHSKSLASSSCMRLQALYILGHPQGKCKINLLNRQLVTAEEMASAANFHNPKDRQFQDRKRDDSQDLPPVLFL